jgi:hypothetical protein
MKTTMLPLKKITIFSQYISAVAVSRLAMKSFSTQYEDENRYMISGQQNLLYKVHEWGINALQHLYFLLFGSDLDEHALIFPLLTPCRTVCSPTWYMHRLFLPFTIYPCIHFIYIHHKLFMYHQFTLVEKRPSIPVCKGH